MVPHDLLAFGVHSNRRGLERNIEAVELTGATATAAMPLVVSYPEASEHAVSLCVVTTSQII